VKQRLDVLRGYGLCGLRADCRDPRGSMKDGETVRVLASAEGLRIGEQLAEAA
jgi:hypothetical protein